MNVTNELKNGSCEKVYKFHAPDPEDVYDESDSNLFRQSSRKKCIICVVFVALIFAIFTFICIAGLYYSFTHDKTEVEPVNNTHIEPATNSTTVPFIRTHDVQPFDLKDHPNYHLFNAPNCGEISADGRVGNGEQAGLMEFKWAVLLYALNTTTHNVTYSCGGTLISEDLVLTAAHCFHHDVEIVAVVLGEYDTTRDNDTARDYDNQDIDYTDSDFDEVKTADPDQVYDEGDFDYIIHPLYDPVNVHNDIALIKLKTPAKITQNNIEPICLPFDHENLPENRKIIVTGFGTTEHNNGSSEILMKGLVRVITNEECQETYKNLVNPKKITEKQFCVKGKVNKDKQVQTCRGDSGGAVQIPVPNSGDINYFQFGIVSFGRKEKCGKNSHPSVNTKVYPYLKWILDNAK